MINKKLGVQSLRNVKTMVILALLTALSVLLERFLGINTGVFKLHFGYLPIAMAGMLYGIVPAALVAFIADGLSNIANFDIFFAALSLIEGAVYGVFLHNKQNEENKTILQAVFCQLVISLIIQAGLNTLLLWTLYRSFLPLRFLTNALTFPVKVYTLYLLLRYRGVFEQHAR